MLQLLYLRYGLHWRHRYVPVVSALILIVIVIGMLAWGYLAQVWLEHSRLELLWQKEEAIKTLLDCMNGRAVWTQPNGKKTGFGFRVHRCLGMEEYDV